MSARTEPGSPANLESVLDEISEAADGSSNEVRVDDMLDKVGKRSFGPLLLVPSLIALSPLGGIPGLPTVLAVLVILIASQLVIGFQHFWVPGIIRHRSVGQEKLDASIKVLRPIARVVDKMLQPRLTRLTKEPFVHLAAVLCILVALTVPPLEIVPFAGAVSWAAIAAFGLSLIARDGLLALIAFGFSLGAAYVLYTVAL